MVEQIEIRQLSGSDWKHIEVLFGDKGACGGCWCMYWRVERGGRAWDTIRGEPARERFRALVSGGNVNGLLAFDRDVPIGWVCVSPYEDFPRLQVVRALRYDRLPGTWSIVCFYVKPRMRGGGLGLRLLQGARDLAIAAGATIVEGYPVTVHEKKPAGAFVWTGVPAMYEQTGFTRVGKGEMSRHIWVYRRPK